MARHAPCCAVLRGAAQMERGERGEEGEAAAAAALSPLAAPAHGLMARSLGPLQCTARCYCLNVGGTSLSLGGWCAACAAAARVTA